MPGIPAAVDDVFLESGPGLNARRLQGVPSHLNHVPHQRRGDDHCPYHCQDPNVAFNMGACSNLFRIVHDCSSFSPLGWLSDAPNSAIRLPSSADSFMSCSLSSYFIFRSLRPVRREAIQHDIELTQVCALGDITYDINSRFSIAASGHHLFLTDDLTCSLSISPYPR